MKFKKKNYGDITEIEIEKIKDYGKFSLYQLYKIKDGKKTPLYKECYNKEHLKEITNKQVVEEKVFI